jgi:hypothetical protein
VAHFYFTTVRIAQLYSALEILRENSNYDHTTFQAFTSVVKQQQESRGGPLYPPNNNLDDFFATVEKLNSLNQIIGPGIAEIL